MIQDLNAANFVDAIETKGKPVMVDFWAQWCGPCKLMSNRIEELAQEMSNKAVITKVNVDEESMISDSYNVQTIPTFMVFHNGEVVEEVVGMVTKEQLKETLSKYIQ